MALSCKNLNYICHFHVKGQIRPANALLIMVISATARNLAKFDTINSAFYLHITQKKKSQFPPIPPQILNDIAMTNVCFLSNGM